MCDNICNSNFRNSVSILNKELALSSELRNVMNDNKFKMNTKIKVLDNIHADTDSKRESLRVLAIAEVLSSEVSYLQQIEKIIKYFMIPIKCNNYLTICDYSTIFGSIQTIYSVNGELLTELKNDINNISSAFIRLAPFFKLYSVYAYDYKKSMCLLQELQLSNPDFKKFLQKQELKPEVQTKLPALLIAPIQRIPRYRLLLKQVIDFTLPNDPNYKKLLHSLKEIEQTADHINNLVEEQENMELLLKLQQCLQNGQPCIIKPGRRLIKVGFLMKMSRKGNRGFPRYFVLMNDILMYCKVVKHNPKIPNSLQCCCILPLNKCVVNEIFQKGVFKITCHDEVIVLYTDCQEDAADWIEVLNSSIKTYVESRKTLRKDSSARRPARKRSVFEYEHYGLSPGFRRQKRKIQTLDESEDIYQTAADTSADSSDENTCFPKLKRPRVNNFSQTPFSMREFQETLAPIHLNIPANEESSQTKVYSHLQDFFTRIKTLITNMLHF